MARCGCGQMWLWLDVGVGVVSIMYMWVHHMVSYMGYLCYTDGVCCLRLNRNDLWGCPCSFGLEPNTL